MLIEEGGSLLVGPHICAKCKDRVPGMVYYSLTKTTPEPSNAIDQVLLEIFGHNTVYTPTPKPVNGPEDLVPDLPDDDDFGGQITGPDMVPEPVTP